MITRKDYMASEDSGMHCKYYAQFVSKEIENLILKRIGMDRLLSSTDKYFNDIAGWDMIITLFDTSYIDAALKRCGDVPSISGYVCIFKECARQMVEHHKERGE